jgi:hypothetical protein
VMVIALFPLRRLLVRALAVASDSVQCCKPTREASFVVAPVLSPLVTTSSRLVVASANMEGSVN